MSDIRELATHNPFTPLKSNQLIEYEIENSTHYEITRLDGFSTSNDKFMIYINIEGTTLSMDLDTGAVLILISYIELKTLNAHNKRLFKAVVEMEISLREV